MIRIYRPTAIGFTVVVVALLAGLQPSAQAQLQVDWYSIDGGGGTVAAGSLVLHGTIGQADAGGRAAGTYVLSSGLRAVGHCAVGDIDEDGHVDVVDLLYMVDSFGAVRGDAVYNAACDFNYDASVDVVDLLYLIGNFGT